MPVIPITPQAPLKLDLTFDYLVSVGRQPLFIGAKYRQRFQARDENDAAIDLTGATIRFTATKDASSSIRKTGVTSAEAPAAQVVIDAGQGSEDTVNFTGKGWFEIHYDPVAVDVAELAPLEGRAEYDIAIRRSGQSDDDIYFSGKIDVRKPKTPLPIP